MDIRKAREAGYTEYEINEFISHETWQNELEEIGLNEDTVRFLYQVWAYVPAIKASGVIFTRGLEKILTKYFYTMFIADMSDDYFGRTIPEQRAAKANLAKDLAPYDWEKLSNIIK